MIQENSGFNDVSIGIDNVRSELSILGTRAAYDLSFERCRAELDSADAAWQSSIDSETQDESARESEAAYRGCFEPIGGEAPESTVESSPGLEGSELDRECLERLQEERRITGTVIDAIEQLAEEGYELPRERLWPISESATIASEDDDGVLFQDGAWAVLHPAVPLPHGQFFVTFGEQGAGSNGDDCVYDSLPGPTELADRLRDRGWTANDMAEASSGTFSERQVAENKTTCVTVTAATWLDESS